MGYHRNLGGHVSCPGMFPGNTTETSPEYDYVLAYGIGDYFPTVRQNMQA